MDSFVIEEEKVEKYCCSCGSPFLEFRDKLSKEEYFISGMCQTCQDIIFGDKYQDSDFGI